VPTEVGIAGPYPGSGADYYYNPHWDFSVRPQRSFWDPEDWWIYREYFKPRPLPQQEFKSTFRPVEPQILRDTWDNLGGPSAGGDFGPQTLPQPAPLPQPQQAQPQQRTGTKEEKECAKLYRGRAASPIITLTAADRKQVKFIDKGLPTEKVATLRGISVDEDKSYLRTHVGGPIRTVISIPPTLKKIPWGRPTHYEIVPVNPMTWDEYVAEVKKIVLGPVEP
jgi:hypothetical protein